jgi:hypothetical protein
MPADPTPYCSERLAEAYAFHRPPLHAAIWARIVVFEPLFDGEARSIGFSAVFGTARKACG